MSGLFRLTDTVNGKSLTCHNRMTGTFRSGSGLRGAGIGTITALTFSSCRLPLGGIVALTAGNLPWRLNALTYNASITSGTMTGMVTGMHVTITGRSCSATADGSSATAGDGSTQIHYHNSLAKLKIRSQLSNLHVYGVTGCSNLLKDGDAIAFTSAYTLAPAQTITQS